jgi:transposase
MWYAQLHESTLFVRPLTDAEREHLTKGLRSADAFTLRRCQILLASARGETPRRVAGQLACSDQAVRDAIRAFHDRGLAALTRRSSRPATTHPAFDAAGAERLRELLHRSPRAFGKDTSLWTLPLAAEVSQAEGLTAGPVSGETVRATLARLGVKWQRAKRWIASPDPAYARKKASATA